MRFGRLLVVAALAVGLWACSSTKHVAEDEYLLDRVNITVKDGEEISTEELYNFLRQQPNHKVLGFAKLQLATYSLSGRDTTKWYNRWLRRVGQAPVIYDPELTAASARQLRQALVNRGYMDARVVADTIVRGPRKMAVEYGIYAGQPHYIGTIDYNIPDTVVRRIVLADTAVTDVLEGGALFDRNRLDEERGRIVDLLRNAGYYEINRDCITYTADTVAGSKEVGLTLNLRAPGPSGRPMGEAFPAGREDSTGGVFVNKPYFIGRVYFVLADNITSVEGLKAASGKVGLDTVAARTMDIIYGGDPYLRPAILEEKCYLEPGMRYQARAVDRTYEALGRLSIVKFVNIELVPVSLPGAPTGLLDAYVFLSRNKKQSIALELEGTNSEGDLGFGIGLTYQHRNLARGSQLLTAKFRTAYESLSGNVEGLINNRYSEYSGEVGITFPKFECPFLSKSFKQRVMASTEFAVSFNYQERPEYTRIIGGVAWKWKWQQQRPGFMRRHTYDLVDINYVRLPRSTYDFINQIAPDNPLLRYSYEDHFIMRMGYSYYRTNRRVPTAQQSAFSLQPYVSTVRASVESAGNLLYGISNAVGQHRSDGVYKILGIQYAQYVKGEVDYSYTRNLDARNALSFHAGFGIAYPYGNSTMVPFEKRFYAGGANGVRGWGVRTLGPGAFDARNSVTDFINQCGDISLLLNAEYRAKIFWVFEGALFVDAGNIWTIKNYETQPGGEFKFNKFYKQIALAYGVGLRMDFTYFLLRLDLGLKAHNPAANQEPWPLIHPKWSRDANFHFSVGYPF
ncbi:MAG: BamA/TamA family outer membrane protein [Muribaculaceae bacterium]|nr:BamA/TamA family outer membrane protein [Muribaculaceae bacterium]